MLQPTDNPYRALREATGISTREFAKKYDLAKTTLTYIETGQYANLSDYQINSLGQECAAKGVDAAAILTTGWSASTLQEAYETSQHASRKAAHNLFDIEPPERSTAELSPFHFFIKATTGSAQGFCKTLKVPASHVLRFTTGKTRTMPLVIERALRETGMSQIGKLIAMQVAWTDEHVK